MQTLRRFTLFLFAAVVTGLPALATPNPDESAVRALVAEAYFDGAYNALDTRAMRAGFHPDFAIFGAEGEAMERFSIEAWITAIETRKAKPDFKPASATRDCRLLLVDVTGGSAAVKAEIYKDGKLQFTDYLSLLKFASGWKIVAKVYTAAP